MNPTEDHFEGSFETVDAGPLATELNRRKETRENVDLTLYVRLLSVVGQPEIRVRARDLSTSGIGVISRRPFKKSELFALVLQVGNLPGRLVLCQTAHCESAPAQQHKVGAFFLETIPAEKGRQRVPAAWVARAMESVRTSPEAAAPSPDPPPDPKTPE